MNAFRVDDPYLDYFLIYGPKPKEIIERSWQLTGRGGLPPLWSFGVWMSRCMYRDAEQVRGVVEQMRELEIPLDVVNVDPRWLEHRKHHEKDACDFVWDEAAFGTAEEFSGWLRDRHVRLCLWENPYVWRDTAFYEEGAKKGYFAPGPDGKPAPSLDNEREAVVLDFTNPDATRWWQDQHRPLLRAGVSAFKSDYGEGCRRRRASRTARRDARRTTSFRCCTTAPCGKRSSRRRAKRSSLAVRRTPAHSAIR